MTSKIDRIGWIGAGRMGVPMVERLLNNQVKVTVWNRTRAKAFPLTKYGAQVVDHVADLATCNIIFSVLATAADLDTVLFSAQGLLSGSAIPKIIVDFSTIGLDDSANIRAQLKERGIDFIASPVSGNGKVVAAGMLSAIMSGPPTACERVRPYLAHIAARGVSYAGEGDLARVCKIAHNLMLGVVIQNLCEITLLAQKSGVPRYAFLEFLNNSVMGSMFTRYKSPSLVNLDWTPTFTAELLRKDLDLGLKMARELNVAMPLTAATRELIQSHIGLNASNSKKLDAQDFASILETMATFSNTTLQSENKTVLSGLETAVI